jgi:hypothetical protein
MHHGFPSPHKIGYCEVYGDATTNHSGSETKAGHGAVFNRWFMETRPLTVEKLVEDVIADFLRSIGCIGVFVQDGKSATGHLIIAHEIQSFHGVPGSHTRDRKLPFEFEGDVTNADIATMALECTQWEIMSRVNAHITTTWVLQLLAVEPDGELIGPFRAADASV